MKNYILPLLIIALSIMSCQKEDDIITPIAPITPSTETTIITDTTTNNTTILDTNYKLVKCTFEYIDYNDQSNNVSYFGYPYSEYGTTTNFKNDGVDTITVNMPMYPSTYYNPTTPLYLPNGEPEWFYLIVNDIVRTEYSIDMNIDMTRVICTLFIYDMDFHFYVTEDNGTIILTLSDIGDNWRTTQTMCFEPM